MRRCSSLQLKISTDRIHYLKFILEGYDSLATLSTINSREGLVEIRYPPEVKKDLTELLNEIVPDLVG
ncbi:MAG: DUF4911 domain-containing protein [Deltaproteobacteria bacterium]|jgi:hypothetical protein|nr:DUF4911 domain-containing protein [Deltaproteobacteria bacterium]